MTIITGYTHLLRESLRGTPALLEKVEAIAKAGDRASSLTRQLLAFSRRQMTQPKVLNLNDLLSDMGTMLQRLLREDIELTISTYPRLGLIKADPGQIEQVIMNLVINARDAMPQGGKLVLKTANISFEKESANHYPEWSRAPTFALRSATPAPEWMPIHEPTSSSPSLPPKDKAKAPGWD